MDTLVSLGTLSAYLWSLWALFFGDAGMPGMTMPLQLHRHPGRGRRRGLLRGARRASPSSCSRAATSRPGPSGAPARPCGPCSTLGRQGRGRAARTASRSGCRSTRWSVGDRFVVRPGREDRHRRCGRRGHVGDRRLDAHRRERAGRGGRRRRRHRRHGERRRPAGRAGHPGGRRHQARPHGAPGGRRRRAARRPCSGWPTASPRCSSPSSWSSRSRPSRGWLARRAAGRGRVHRRGGGADHRLPLRTRSGHPDRAAGRHRPGRAARHPHQGPRGARVDARASTRSCSTRPARSPPAAWSWST